MTATPTSETPFRARRLQSILILAALVFSAGSTGCAALTGAVTGVFTGPVDAPAEVYRYHRDEFEEHPEYWMTTIVTVPVGLVLGPLAGFGKGLSLDCAWIAGKGRYGEAYRTYDNASVWRPYTFHWNRTTP
jgi:hypothetical protein